MFKLAIPLYLAITFSHASSLSVNFSQSDFTSVTPSFSGVTTFDMSMLISGATSPGQSFSDPALLDIHYSVSGILDPTTPSGFPGFIFRLDHIYPSAPPISGSQFYALNNTLAMGDTIRFDISSTADLSDGLQLSELNTLPASYGTNVIFHFNGQENGLNGNPGRYHPYHLQLFSDGTGLLQNSNNSGGVNPSTNEVVDVNFGEEYVTNLVFDPNTFPLGTIPEPTSGSLLLFSFLGLVMYRKRR